MAFCQVILTSFHNARNSTLSLASALYHSKLTNSVASYTSRSMVSSESAVSHRESLCDTHTHTHTLSLSLSHTQSLSHIHTHSLSLSHTHTLSLSLSHTHSHTHTHTHTHTPSEIVVCLIFLWQIVLTTE